MSDRDKAGPTGRYPRGKLRPEDQGELVIATAADYEGNVLLNFGTPVIWAALPFAAARKLAETILIQADKAESRARRN